MYNPSYLTTDNQFTIHTIDDSHHRVSLSQMRSMYGSPQAPGLADGVQYINLLHITHFQSARGNSTTKTEMGKCIKVMRCNMPLLYLNYQQNFYLLANVYYS